MSTPPTGRPEDLDELLQEFLGRPEGQVRDGSLIIRPSLRAAAARAMVAFLVILLVSIPILGGLFLEEDDSSFDSTVDVLFTFVDIAFNLIFPLLVSLYPAIQLVFTRYVIDDEGIRERIQIISKTEKRVKWEKVTAMRHRRTLFDRMLGIERLDVIAYGQRGATIHLVGLRAAPQIRNMVGAQMRRAATADRLFRND